MWGLSVYENDLREIILIGQMNLKIKYEMKVVENALESQFSNFQIFEFSN